MKTNILKKEQRGLMQNAEFTGHALFSNGSKGTLQTDQFGALFVFNDDFLYPDSRLGMHPHARVEIVTIMVEGRESHEDNMGNRQELLAGDVQLISSGTGIYHAGGNISAEALSRHLQIWVHPRSLHTPPSLQLRQKTDDLRSDWTLLVSPNGSNDSLVIKQDIWFNRRELAAGETAVYRLQNADHGVMIYVLEGSFVTGSVTVKQEDTLFISQTAELSLQALKKSVILLIETVLD